MMVRTRLKHCVTVFAVVAVCALALPSFAASEADCAARADRAARNSTDVTKGAVVGGAGGAAFGAIVSGSNKSIWRGGALGAVVGGAVGASKKNDIYKNAYDACMRGK